MKKVVIVCILLSFSVACRKVSLEDTPYIAEFRERYELNKGNEAVVVLKAKSGCEDERIIDLPCTENDIKVMRQQAKENDLFSMAVIGSMDHKPRLLKKLADLGEPASLILYTPNINDDAKKNIYLRKSDSMTAYILRLYNLVHVDSVVDDDFCIVANEGYALYGNSLTAHLINDSDFKSALSKCDINIDENAPEFLFSKAIYLYNHKDYQKAYEIFEQLDDSTVGISAKYCLGTMIYSGKGVDKNPEKGEQLIYEAYHAGVYILPKQFKQVLPKSKLINRVMGNSCSVK